METSAPTEWSATRNVAWKTVVSGAGHSSPIVWEDRVFTATAMPEKKERVLLCLDHRTGRIRWSRTVLTADLENKSRENGYASCTPATDGERVYVSLLEVKWLVVAAVDFSGKQLNYPNPRDRRAEMHQ